MITQHFRGLLSFASEIQADNAFRAPVILVIISHYIIGVFTPDSDQAHIKNVQIKTHT